MKLELLNEGRVLRLVTEDAEDHFRIAMVAFKSGMPAVEQSMNTLDTSSEYSGQRILDLTPGELVRLIIT